MILYNDGKWDGIWDLPKYQEMRDKITESFKGLTFVEDGHRYFLNGKEMMCVSNVTHMFQEHFDAHQKAIETSERNFDNPDSKYFRMTPKQIEESWQKISKDACDTGTERHLWGESAYAFMTSDGGFEAIHPKEIAIAKFWTDLPKSFVPIAVENITYNSELNYSGTFDMLFYYDAEIAGKDQKYSGFVIFDYKTNKDLYKNFKEKKLLAPFEGLLDMSLNLYKLQLSLYELNLSQIGFNVIGRRLIWLRPDGNYEKIPLESYATTLRNFLLKNPIK